MSTLSEKKDMLKRICHAFKFLKRIERVPFLRKRTQKKKKASKTCIIFFPKFGVYTPKKKEIVSSNKKIM